jgi:hypothetical protein
MSSLFGIWGKPYIDLSDLVSTDALDGVHAEICEGLSLVETTYTGGSLKWMGITAPWNDDDEYRDVNWVLQALGEEQFRIFCSLADASYPDLESLVHSPQMREFSDETDRPLSWRQMRWLEVRHQVYFPWKTCYHFLQNTRWEDNHSGSGKSFEPEVAKLFPRTLALLQSLPFVEIGRAVLFGVHPNDHATAIQARARQSRTRSAFTPIQTSGWCLQAKMGQSALKCPHALFGLTIWTTMASWLRLTFAIRSALMGALIQAGCVHGAHVPNNGYRRTPGSQNRAFVDS